MTQPSPIKVGKPEDIAIGARLRAVRKQMGWSQEKLAEAIGLTFQQVQKYEKGTNRIAAGRLKQVADIFGVNPMTFLPTDGVAPVSQVEIDAFRRELALSIQSIDRVAEQIGAERDRLKAIEARLAPSPVLEHRAAA